jgi:hypothetical protein
VITFGARSPRKFVHSEEANMNRRLFVNLFATILLGSVAALATAQAQDVVKVPDDSVAIHYYRPAGDYDGWGTHIWESYEKVKDGKVVGSKDKSDKPILDIAWTNPMKPTGKDGFGVYWIVKANEFRNGKVNFIIHKGDSKDQCGKDISWFVETQGREVFVNTGDCNTYFKAEDAVIARKK